MRAARLSLPGSRFRYGIPRSRCRWQSFTFTVPDPAAKLQRQFGLTLRAERKARQLTQQELALESGLSLTYVGEIERGKRMVSLETVRRVAHAMNLTGAELLARARL